MALKMICMPKVSQEMEEVVLYTWFVKPGDTVKAGDPLFSAETEKTTVEVESEYSGKITRLLVAQGDTVKLFSEIAEIDAED